jgi:hypothetical protein
MYRAAAFLKKPEHGPPSIVVKAVGTDIFRQKKEYPLLSPPTNVMKCGICTILQGQYRLSRG